MLFNKAIILLSAAHAVKAAPETDHRLRGMNSPTANVAAASVRKYVETNGGVLDTVDNNAAGTFLKDDSKTNIRLMTPSEQEAFEAQVREYHDRPIEFIPHTPFGATYGGVDLTHRIRTETNFVHCGDGRMEASCTECPQGNGADWCGGTCFWNSKNEVCQGTDPVKDLMKMMGATEVVCGGHSAATCAECNFDSNGANMGSGWCNGDCYWNSDTSACQDTDPSPPTCAAEDMVVCGGHSACSCAECPQGNGAGWCNGECWWNDVTSACEVPPQKDCGGGVLADDCTACEGTAGSTCSSNECESMPSPDASSCRYVLTNEARSASEYLNFNTIPVSEPAWWFQKLDMLAAASSTFYATNGHSFGYSGFQVSTESPMDGRILFSIWDQGGCDQDNDPSCPAAQIAETIACGTGIKCTDFGGEGTGRKSIVYSDTLPILDTPYYAVTYARSVGAGSYRMQYSSFFYVPGSENWNAKPNESGASYTSTPPGWRFLSTIEVATNANDQWYMSSLYAFLEQWTEAEGLEHRSGLFGPHWVAGVEGDFQQITEATFNHGTTENFKHINAFMSEDRESVGMEMGGSVTKSATHGQVFTVPSTAEPAELVSFKLIKACLETLSLGATEVEVEGCLATQHNANDTNAPATM